ncbi:MAG TPA: NAD(P)H-binding protein [Phnomibacter sp.]|nr:NAD(P)H-binding protein [Phnomibacter sp.]
MVVTIFGATGMVGKQLITHSLARGWQVRAFGRQIDEFLDKDIEQDKLVAIKGYVFDAGDVKKALKGSDAVLSALGGSVEGTDHTRSLGMKNIVAQMEKYGPKRIVALGGLGVLESPDGSGPLFEQDSYPQEFVAVAREHYGAYQHLKNSSLDWTFVCSPNILDVEADGRFEAVAEAPASTWEVNAGNLALFMTQAIEFGTFIKQRAGISNIP